MNSKERIEMIERGLFECSDRPAEMRGMMKSYSIEYSREEVKQAADRLGKIDDFKRAMQEMDEAHSKH